ncbi:RDD family protein [Mesorhizobium sp. LHD-90]|uniref:RDD family protein n=1 Tax=Mesorhizobium sp. LHD-90 TaxID=3071414 RepID=UPI0027DECEE3|nr:RDD family protein [Mesorhizobium sp. LHD-90]MDQ6432796.1 RDD family protein [Mesorhizobium sp. LHD-90]
MARPSKRQPGTRRRSLVTPEGVDLGVTLADAGARAGAFFLDATFIIIAGILITLVALFGLGGLGLDGVEPIAIVWIVFVFFLRNAYFLAFEAGRGARTPGKRIMGLRVASRDGSGLAIDQVIARNLMREIEVFLPLSMLLARAGTGVADTLTTVFGLAWALIFALFPLFNRDRMRIGDLLAGTWVVEAPKRALAEDLARRVDREADVYRFTPEQLDAYGIAELHKLEEVLRGDNDAALDTVARAIGDKIGMPYRGYRARPFLTAYYTELRAHLERKLLLGKRRASKHDA